MPGHPRRHGSRSTPTTSTVAFPAVSSRHGPTSGAARRGARAACRQGREAPDRRACRAIWPDAEPATEADWATEYLDLILAVRVVDGLDDALAHIARWGTRNSEAVIARDLTVARRFARAVDSGSVFVNTSTRFSDGGEFGYGLEIGVSTQKLHARGPMGLSELTSTKWIVWGDGQTRPA